MREENFRHILSKRNNNTLVNIVTVLIKDKPKIGKFITEKITTLEKKIGLKYLQKFSVKTIYPMNYFDLEKS